MLERICQLRVALIPFPMSPPALFPLFIAERFVLQMRQMRIHRMSSPMLRMGGSSAVCAIVLCAVCLCENEGSAKLRDREIALGLGFKSTKEIPIHYFSALVCIDSDFLRLQFVGYL